MKNEILNDLNRRDFLRGGSLASLMMLMGAVPINGAEEEKKVNPDGSTDYKGLQAPVPVGVIGCGAWGRELIKTLLTLPNGPVLGVCDTSDRALRRTMALFEGGSADTQEKAEKPAGKPKEYKDYKELLASKEIKAVLVATPTHLHQEIVQAAVKAGKHVYCEAPLAASLEDARAIAVAARDNPQVYFQAGLQNRADKQVLNLNKFVRTGVLGRPVKVRSQFHKKQQWRLAVSDPTREREVNWRLQKDLSVGLIGEIGIHQIDVASWFLFEPPVAVTGYGALLKWNEDGRDVFDTVQALVEYPGGVLATCECTIANSFDAEMAMLYGTDCAIMMRERRAWMFKEVDAPLLGWEVYAKKDAFYKESGIVLGAGATGQKAHTAKTSDDSVDPKSAVQYALEAFLANSHLVGSGVEDYSQVGDLKDTAELRKYLATLDKNRVPAAGFKEGFEAAVTVIKANEAILKGQRLAFQKEWFELG